MSRPSSVTNEQKEQIKLLLTTTEMTYEQIAKSIPGCSRHQVRYIAKIHIPQLNQPKKRASLQSRQSILDLFDQRHPPEQIKSFLQEFKETGTLFSLAQKYKMSWIVAKRIVLEAGLSIRQENKPPADDTVIAIANAILSGESYSLIARKFNVSVGTVSRIKVKKICKNLLINYNFPRWGIRDEVLAIARANPYLMYAEIAVRCGKREAHILKIINDYNRTHRDTPINSVRRNQISGEIDQISIHEAHNQYLTLMMNCRNRKTEQLSGDKEKSQEVLLAKVFPKMMYAEIAVRCNKTEEYVLGKISRYVKHHPDEFIPTVGRTWCSGTIPLEEIDKVHNDFKQLGTKRAIIHRQHQNEMQMLADMDAAATILQHMENKNAQQEE